GVVNVLESESRPGQYEMQLVQEDTARLIRDVFRSETHPDGLRFLDGPGALGQDRFVPAEQVRGKLGEMAGPMREAEAEMLKSLRASGRNDAMGPRTSGRSGRRPG